MDLKSRFPRGTKIELVFMDDPQSPPTGTKGEVISVDDLGTIHVKWDNGSALGLIYGKDKFKIV